MMRKGRGLSVRMRAATLAVVLVLLLAACAPATPGSPTGMDSASERATAGPTPSESAAPSPSPSPSEPGATQTATPVAGLSLSSIRMVSPTAGWALDENAFHLYHTTDGGVSWQDVTPPEASAASANLNTLAVMSDQTVWVASIPSEEQKPLTIFLTTDGGKTWKGSVFHAALDRPFGAQTLQFLDATHGWLLGGYGAFAGSEWMELYRTDDGGASWTRVASGGSDDKLPNGLPFGGDKTGVRFVDERNGWLTGHQNAESGEYLYATHDGGKTWRWVDLSVPATYAKAASMFTYPPTFFTPQEGLLPAVFGSDHPTLLFYRTRDGGSTWQATTLLPGAQTFHGYQWSVLDSGHIFASDGSQIYLSSDEGQTWKTVEPDAKLAPLAQLDFVSPEVGWALVGDLQVDELLELWKTTDGGRHWSALP